MVKVECLLWLAENCVPEQLTALILEIEIKSKLEADGNAVFFYKFCVEPSGRLCPSPMVGAFFKTSGHAMLYDSKAATRYVLARGCHSAKRIASGESQLILITPKTGIRGNGRCATPTAILVSLTINGDD